ncbi:MAG: histidine phosphatase family protein [Chitinispirillaceae bacterium]
MTTTFILIRHGNIDMAGRIPGRLDGVHLSPDGEMQAFRIVDHLKSVPVNAIYSSPLDRAVETATPLARQRGIDIQREDAFAEIDFGAWTGKHFGELERDFGWKQFHFFRNGCVIPQGELMIQVQTRMVAKLERLCVKHPGEVVAVVSHHDPIKSVVAHYLGVSLDMFLRFRISTGSISVVSVSEDSAQVKCVNFSGDVPGEKSGEGQAWHHN